MRLWKGFALFADSIFFLIIDYLDAPQPTLDHY